MANYHAVYIDSPSSWTYAPDSYDSKLGFYTNAWLTNQTEEESETPVISCSYFYEIGKEDDVGFTPRRINYNSSSGILTVEGKQSGVPSLVSKSFRKKSPSPRFLNLRESLRKRRPARFIVSQIITDDNDSLVNIKKYLGIDEEGEEKSAEEFGAEEFDDMGYSLNMDRFSYQNEGKVRDIDGKELRQYRIYFGKEPMFYLNDAVFGYDNNNTVQEVVDDLNEALQDSIREVFQRLLWKSQRPDSLDVMLRGEEFGAEMNHLWMADALWDNLVYASRMGFLELHMGEMNLPLMVRMGRMKMPENLDELSKAIGESPKSTARLLANYAEHNGWITVDIRNKIVKSVGFKAEEFEADTADVDFDEAYMERQDAERIMKLLRIVKRKATGSNARYAKTYADAAEMAYYDYGFKGLKTQVAYVLSNLGGWRGDEAKQVKAELRKLMR